MLAAYAAASFLTGTSVIGSAFRATGKVSGVAVYLAQSKFSVLLLVNWALCVLILFGKAVQHVFLGALRESEQSKLQERLLNFALFKVMFIAAMLEHGIGSVTVWLLWFVACSVLKTFSLLGRERVDYLVGLYHGGGAAEIGHKRPLMLLGLVLAVDAAIVGSAFLWCSSVSFALLLSYECVCIAIDCCHGFAKALFSRSADTLSHSNYVIELSSDCVFLLASLLHYLHILYLLGVSFTLIDVILLLNMRSVVLSLFRRYSSYRLFLAMEGELRDRYPTVEGPDIPADQVCAICRESMESAKRLPCDHLYHLSCIRSWLEQNQHNCPLCRYDLRKSVGGHPAPNAAANANAALPRGGPWFLPFIRPNVEQEQQEVQQIFEMFPQADRNAIAADLARTGSVEETIENLVEGRVPNGFGDDHVEVMANNPIVEEEEEQEGEYGDEAGEEEAAEEWGGYAEENEEEEEEEERRGFDDEEENSREEYNSGENENNNRERWTPSPAAAAVPAQHAAAEHPVEVRRRLVLEAAMRRAQADW